MIRPAPCCRCLIIQGLTVRNTQVHELDDMMESSTARDGARRPANNGSSVPQSWDGWLDADAEGAAAEIASLLRAARVNATVDPNAGKDPAPQGRLRQCPASEPRPDGRIDCTRISVWLTLIDAKQCIRLEPGRRHAAARLSDAEHTAAYLALIPCFRDARTDVSVASCSHVITGAAGQREQGATQRGSEGVSRLIGGRACSRGCDRRSADSVTDARQHERCQQQCYGGIERAA